MNDPNFMSKPHYFSSLDDIAETLDDHINAFNSVELFSTIHQYTPDIGKIKIREILEQWPSVPSFEILLDKNLLTEGKVRSYFGGPPTLPPSIPWPQFTYRGKEKRSMNFLAQIDCAELTRLYPDHLLPKTGFLYFFDSWSDEDGLSASHPSCKVLHSYNAPDPKPRAVPENIIAPRAWRLNFYKQTHIPRPGDETSLTYPKRKLNLARSKVCLPFADHFRHDLEYVCNFSENGFDNLRNLFDEVYYDLRVAFKKKSFGLENFNWQSYNTYYGGKKFKELKRNEYFGLTIEHRVLGYPRIKAEGIHFSGQRFEDLVLLAQFDSDNAMDFDWHDYLEFWINPQDLTNWDFSNVFARQV